MLGKEDIMSVHLIVGVGGKYGEARIVEEYAFALLFERLNASHIHCILIMAEVERVSIIGGDGRGDWTGQLRLRNVGTLWRSSIGRGTVHFNYKIYQAIINQPISL